MKYKVGDRVRYIGKKTDNYYYPPKGTEGTLNAAGNHDWWVAWPPELTHSDGVWACAERDLEMIERKADMTLKDLKDGMIVRLRNGAIDSVTSSKYSYGTSHNIATGNINDDLKHVHDSQYDIMEVIQPIKTIWKREPEKVKIVVGEIEMMIPQDKAESIKRQIQGM